MTTRATRSQQKASEIANASPARSTRSGGRSVSPAAALSISLRSSSPANLRSASPSSAKNVSASKSAIGVRGRGRGRGRGNNSSPAKDVSTPAQTEVSKAPTRGRGRGRGRGRPPSNKSKQATPLSTVVSLDDHDQIPGKTSNIDDSTKESVADNDNSDSLPASEPMAVENDTTGAAETSDTCEALEKSSKIENDLIIEPIAVDNKAVASETAEPKEYPSENVDDAAAAAEIAALATQLATNPEADQWCPADADNITFTDEHIKQLESVLSSEEGLQLLSEQPGGNEMNDMAIDDEVIEESLQADPIVVAESLTSEVDNSEELNPIPSTAASHPAEEVVPRRRSERVTDLERRALADKIREENIRQEKELLEELKAAKKEESSAETTTEKAASDCDMQPHSKRSKATPTKANATKPAPAKSPTKLSEGTKSSTASKGKSFTVKPKSLPDKKSSAKPSGGQRQTSHKMSTKPEGKMKSPKKTAGQEAKPEAQESAVKSPDGSGWIPGKIRVIDRKSEGGEKDGQRIKRKSQELKRRLSAAADDLFKPDEPVNTKKRRREKPKSLPADEVSGGETSSSESDLPDDDDEWLEEDDPDRLWCVCRKPHDNRFMICCDRCEEWYHGDCVGISRKRGQQMETQNEEYICSQCKEKEILERLGGVENLTVTPVVTSTSPHEPHQTAGTTLASSETGNTSSKAQSKTSTTKTEETSKKVSPVKGEIRKKDSSTSSDKKKRFGKFRANTPRQHCIGSGCENWAEDNKIYCSLNCIIRHSKESLKIISKEKSKTMGAKQDTGKFTPDIVVMERHTGRLVTGAHAPNAANLVAWLTKHPTFEVLRPGQQTGHVSSTAFYGKQKSKLISTDDKSAHKKGSTSKEEESGAPAKKPSGPDTATIRANVRKSLTDILMERVTEISDDKPSEDEIKTIVSSIEHELHRYYGDTNNKYKSKYRSLIFNVKDKKNKGLFRKILRKKLKPSKLVRMTPDEMASKELHQWREKEMQSELEKIKADEERKAAMKPTLRKITHKGEIEVEQETYKDMDVKLEESVKDYDMADRNPSTGRSSTEGVTLSSDQSSDLLSSILGSADTTSQHDAHLFDSNCKICTGKQAAPTGADLGRHNSKKLKVNSSRSIPRQRESSIEEIDKVVNAELKDLEKDIEIYKEEDRIIAERLEKRKRRHKEEEEVAKSRIKFDSSPKQEPSSTVQSPYSPNNDLSSPTPIITSKKKHPPSAWKGFIDVPEVCKFFTTAHGVHGNSDYLKTDLPDALQIVGRIHPSQVWEYINQLKHTTSREVILVRFSAVNEEEKVGYKDYFKYLSEKKRFGVVGNGASTIKDMYIIPLPSHESLPSALKPYRHKVLADDNRPNMLVGLVVRIKSKKPPTSHELKKSKASDAEEPYEPPGLDEIVPAEPETPSPLTTPKPAEPALPNTDAVEEYDPTRPLVSLSAPASKDTGHEDMDTQEDEPYDPIVSAYSLADAGTLNAEDAPGAAPYSPGQEDMEESSEEIGNGKPDAEPYDPTSEPYDPTSEPYDPASEPYDPSSDDAYDPTAPAIKSTSPLIKLPKDSELTAQQLALKQLTEQVEMQRLELERKKALLAAQPPLPPAPKPPSSVQPPTLPPPLPKNIPDIMSGKTLPESLVQSRSHHYVDQRSPASAGSASSTMLSPPLPPGGWQMDSNTQASSDRPKISFSLQANKNRGQPTHRLSGEEVSTHRSYLPPPTEGRRPSADPSPQALMARGSYSIPDIDPRAPTWSEQPLGYRDTLVQDQPYRPRDPRVQESYRREDGNREEMYDDRPRWHDDYDYRDSRRGRGYERGRGGAYRRPPPRGGGYGGGFQGRGRPRGSYSQHERYNRNY